ncbi:heparinase II/III domain-containing protein [Spirosoma rhododendri]|uniref:Heparinase n=1 Tax=Spirosoma rhododendri TaxID=2728024 RepID=A0A7L5DK96_9BACT|nr:heparinase II/III family protein [Spirosoma rhododendri]QJD78869.1 heparinase [Spirosoma rhododendri]
MIRFHDIVLAGLLWLNMAAVSSAQVDSLTASVSPPAHPRILLLRGEEQTLRTQIRADTTWTRLHRSVLAQCDTMLTTTPLERVQIGRRLLATSREALRRIFYLSYAWRLTGNTRYRDRAEAELRAVSRFRDWNPSHFLDVGEMTMAVAIGYDWLYDTLPDSTRQLVSEAIQTKGIGPSLDPRNNGWLGSANNWNQVCNAGMSYGALAIFETQPQLARQVLNRAIRTVILPMGEYAPDGVYPEGYNYWGYGTGFNVLLISALEKAFGRSFGLAEKPGFLQTAGYMEHMTGPTGEVFNYADARMWGELQPAMFWFAARTRQPDRLWEERRYLQRPDLIQKQENARLLPAALLWGSQTPIATIKPPRETSWWGSSKNPVALFRTSWTDAMALFIGLKGGSPRLSHAHMDVGSFVMEADGVRWAMDFGMQEYESLESKGVDLWNMKQDSQRWRIFRYNNYVHNTLTINDALQQVDGKAAIIGTVSTPQFMGATTDMTGVYANVLTSANRGVAIAKQQYVVVQDELTAGDTNATVRWTMLTPATVKLLGDNRAELTKNGKTLIVQAPAGTTLRTWPTGPPQPYDAPNPGTTLLGFETPLPARQSKTLTVFLIPQRSPAVRVSAVPALRNWVR